MGLALPSIRVCRVHEEGTFGRPRPERALLDRVTLNIRATPRTACSTSSLARFPLALYGDGILDSRRLISNVPVAGRARHRETQDWRIIVVVVVIVGECPRVVWYFLLTAWSSFFYSYYNCTVTVQFFIPLQILAIARLSR